MGKRSKDRRAAESVPKRIPPAPPPDPRAEQTSALAKPLSAEERAERQRGARFLFTEALGGGVMERQLVGMLSEQVAAGAVDFIGSIVASVRPRDAVEHMLCVQLAWTHARLAKLSTNAATQENIKSFTAVHQAADADA